MYIFVIIGRNEVHTRDQGCNEFDDDEEQKKCDLSISSSITVLSIYTKELNQSPEKPDRKSNEAQDLWWRELTEIVLDILETGEALVCVQLAQIMVPKDKDLPLGGRTRSEMLEMIWGRLVAMHERGVVRLEGVNQNIYLILCALSDAYFPSSTEESTDKANDTGLDCSRGLNLLEVELFWKLIQQGLIHSNSLTRKRGSYLMKRAVDVAATSGRSIGQGSHGLAEQPLFSWDPAEKEKQLRLWFEFFLIYETLEEVQVNCSSIFCPCSFLRKVEIMWKIYVYKL